LAATLTHPNGGDFLGQLAIPVKENVKVVITQSGKITTEPKAKSKKMSPTDPVKEKEKVEVEVEAELRPKKKKTLVRLFPRTSVIHTCYCSPVKQRSM
jgi:hypothetical protein